MGPTHDQTENANGTVHIVNHAGQQRPVVILDRRGEEAYIHYVNTDKRLDEWVPANTIQLVSAPTPPASSAGIKRKRSHSVDDSADQSTALDNSARSSTSPPRAPMDHLAESKEQDQEAVNEHQRITAKRNFEKVIFGAWQIKTWYYSPYPLAEDDVAPTSLTVGNGAGSHAPSPSANGPPSSSRRSHLHPDGPETGPVPGGPGTPILRIHGRTAELLASSGVGRTSSNEPTQLWVCDRCFKYMRDGISWELHMVRDGLLPPLTRYTNAIWML
ncbi:hypothetical protein FRB99_006437 [Tulasnella sp. 403]|nr:hypothetical protein FRB99_006437 [Tulasnella sp. 403]